MCLSYTTKKGDSSYKKNPGLQDTEHKAVLTSQKIRKASVLREANGETAADVHKEMPALKRRVQSYYLSASLTISYLS